LGGALVILGRLACLSRARSFKCFTLRVRPVEKLMKHSLLPLDTCRKCLSIQTSKVKYTDYFLWKFIRTVARENEILFFFREPKIQQTESRSTQASEYFVSFFIRQTVELS
jgi:hypothetical protein